jgi:hypothetical protein
METQISMDAALLCLLRLGPELVCVQLAASTVSSDPAILSLLTATAQIRRMSFVCISIQISPSAASTFQLTYHMERTLFLHDRTVYIYMNI